MIDIDDLQFYVLINSILVLSGNWYGDTERLCAMQPSVGWKDFHLKWV